MSLIVLHSAYMESVKVRVQTRRQLYCRVAQKLAQFWYALTLPNINRFSQLFHCQNQKKICNNIITQDPTTPQVCRYITL